MIRPIKKFFNKYRSYILFNKNIIIAGTAALVVAIFFSHTFALYYKNNFLNSVVTLSVEYAVYIPIFALLFYLDNKKKYIDPLTGKKNDSKIKRDVIKLFTIFSISEIIYSVSKISVHYELMQISFEPYQASMIGSFTAWFIFLVFINIGARIVKLFKHNDI